MDQNLFVSVVFALLISGSTQPVLSLIKVYYRRQISAVPQIIALQPYWGIGIGINASLFLNTAVSRGWAEKPPSWSETWQQVLHLSGVSLAAAITFILLGAPTLLAATKGLRLRKRDFFLAFLPVMVGAPAFTIVSLITFKLIIGFAGEAAIQLTPVVLSFIFNLLVDVVCFEYIKRRSN